MDRCYICSALTLTLCSILSGSKHCPRRLLLILIAAYFNKLALYADSLGYHRPRDDGTTEDAGQSRMPLPDLDDEIWVVGD